MEKLPERIEALNALYRNRKVLLHDIDNASTAVRHMEGDLNEVKENIKVREAELFAYMKHALSKEDT